MIFWPRPCSTTSARTIAPSTPGEPTRVELSPLPATSRTRPRSGVSPGSPVSRSTAIVSPVLTRYCFPPVSTMAYMVGVSKLPTTLGSHGADKKTPRARLKQPRGFESIQAAPTKALNALDFARGELDDDLRLGLVAWRIFEADVYIVDVKGEL